MVMSLFAGRLLQLQGVEAAAYAATAEAERLRTVTISATRGAITDAHGVALATTVDAVNVTADQSQIADPVAVAAALAPVLGEPIGALEAKLKGDSRFAYIAKMITPRRWDAVAALRLPGIYSEPTSRRVYPQGTLSAALLGFVGSDGRGLAGLENSWDRRARRQGRADHLRVGCRRQKDSQCRLRDRGLDSRCRCPTHDRPRHPVHRRASDTPKGQRGERRQRHRCRHGPSDGGGAGACHIPLLRPARSNCSSR